MLRSNSVGNVVQQNTLTGNNVGILVFGGVDNILGQNILSANRMAGIRINVIATGNLIMGNTIASNPAGHRLQRDADRIGDRQYDKEKYDRDEHLRD